MVDDHVSTSPVSPGGQAVENDSAATDSVQVAVGSAKVVPALIDVGWTVAVLFGHLPSQNDEQPRLTLPSENELAHDERIQVELTRLECLLRGLDLQVAGESLAPQDSVEVLRRAQTVGRTVLSA